MKYRCSSTSRPPAQPVHRRHDCAGHAVRTRVRFAMSAFADFASFGGSLTAWHAGFSLIVHDDCSTVTKQDSRCRHTYVCNVHKVWLLSTTLQAVYSKDTSIEMRQRHYLGALPARSTTFGHFYGERQTWFWDLLNHLDDFHAGVSRKKNDGAYIPMLRC